MPQALLPLYPSAGEGYITDLLSFEKRDGIIYYFHGAFPIFSHAENDRKSFRLFTSQLVVNGTCRQVDVIKAFGVSPISVKRAVKKYREGGAAAFFKKPRPRSSHVLTPDILQKAQDFLNEGLDRSEIANRLEVKEDTLYRAIRAGRLVEPVKKMRWREAPKANGA